MKFWAIVEVFISINLIANTKIIRRKYIVTTFFGSQGSY